MSLSFIEEMIHRQLCARKNVFGMYQDSSYTDRFTMSSNDNHHNNDMAIRAPTRRFAA
jgi:hypothetical protein